MEEEKERKIRIILKKLGTVLATTFMISILLMAGLFIGEIIRQEANGTMDTLSAIEISIIISAIILSIELAIVTTWKLKKRKEKNKPTIDELVKEARKITY